MYMDVYAYMYVCIFCIYIYIYINMNTHVNRCIYRINLAICVFGVGAVSVCYCIGHFCIILCSHKIW